MKSNKQANFDRKFNNIQWSIYCTLSDISITLQCKSLQILMNLTLILNEIPGQLKIFSQNLSQLFQIIDSNRYSVIIQDNSFVIPFNIGKKKKNFKLQLNQSKLPQIDQLKLIKKKLQIQMDKCNYIQRQQMQKKNDWKILCKMMDNQICIVCKSLIKCYGIRLQLKQIPTQFVLFSESLKQLQQIIQQNRQDIQIQQNYFIIPFKIGIIDKKIKLNFEKYNLSIEQQLQLNRQKLELYISINAKNQQEREKMRNLKKNNKRQQSWQKQ